MELIEKLQKLIKLLETDSADRKSIEAIVGRAQAGEDDTVLRKELDSILNPDGK